MASVCHAQEVLPRPEPPFKGHIGATVQDSTLDFPQQVKAPEGAPNILLIMTDDVGFGASSTFGGPIPTPTMDGLAKEGLRYTQFHSTALCSPTRGSIAHRAQSPLQRHGRYHGTGHGFPRLQLADAEEQWHICEGSQTERLQHGLVWQKPQRPRLAVEPGWAVRSLADRVRL
jgi:Sulfatase